MDPKMKQIYVVEYKSADWAGASSHCLVMAESEEDAEELSQDFIEQDMYDTYSGEYEDNVEELEGPYSTIVRIVPLKGSEYEQYVKNDSQQRTYYPEVNFEYE